MSQIGTIFEPLAERKKIKLQTFVQGIDISQDHTFEVLNLVPNLIGDERRLKQILINLVKNAVKFTESGSVGLIVFYDPQPESLLTIEVHDTGVGIHQEDIAKLFTQFAKLPRTA